MAALSTEPPLNTFVVRFWREWSAAGIRWRGQIHHVQSGTSAKFLDLGEMSEILQSFGVMTGKASQTDDITYTGAAPPAEPLTGSKTEVPVSNDRAQPGGDAAE